MFDLTEEAFDQVAILVECGIETPPLGCCSSARNDGFRACSGDGVHGSLAVIALVRQHMACRQAIKQGFNLGDVIAFPTRQDEANGVAKRISGGMNLGTQAAF